MKNDSMMKSLHKTSHFSGSNVNVYIVYYGRVHVVLYEDFTQIFSSQALSGPMHVRPLDRGLKSCQAGIFQNGLAQGNLELRCAQRAHLTGTSLHKRSFPAASQAFQGQPASNVIDVLLAKARKPSRPVPCRCIHPRGGCTRLDVLLHSRQHQFLLEVLHELGVPRHCRKNAIRTGILFISLLPLLPGPKGFFRHHETILPKTNKKNLELVVSVPPPSIKTHVNTQFSQNPPKKIWRLHYGKMFMYQPKIQGLGAVYTPKMMIVMFLMW